MVKTNKKLALILSLVMLLLAFGSVFAISSLFTRPMQTVEASTLSDADIAYRRANPGLYETGTTTLKKSWQELITTDADSGRTYIKIENGRLQVNDSENVELAGDLVCGKVENLTSLKSAFAFAAAESTNLTEIDLSNLDTRNVTDMSMMFDYCTNSSLTSIDLSMLDTSKVEDMSGMFLNSGFKTIKFGGKFVTTNVKNMQSMFDFSAVTGLDLSSFDTRNVTDMRYMFGYIQNLSKLDLSSFVINSACQTDNIFSSLSMVGFYMWRLDDAQMKTYFNADTIDQRIEVWKEKFGGEDGLNQFYSQVGGKDKFIKMFCSDSQINELITPQMPSGKTTKFVFPENMFYVEKNDSSNTAVPALNSTTNGKTLVLYQYDPTVAETGLFRNGKQIKTWRNLLADGDITVTDGALQVVNKDLEGDLICGNVDGLTSLTMAFMNCSKLTSLDLSRLNTSGVTDMSGAFMGCSFKILNLSGEFVISNGCGTQMMFVSPDMFLVGMAEIENGSDEYNAIMGESTPRARLLKLIDIMNAKNSPEDQITIEDLEASQEEYAQYIAFLSDSTICEIILPTSVSGEIALAPISGQHYAYTSTSDPVANLVASSGSNTKLTLYKDATSAGAEAEPVPFPTTPSGTSETGVVADISMIIIVLVSVIGLAVVATKKKRIAR